MERDTPLTQFKFLHTLRKSATSHSPDKKPDTTIDLIEYESTTYVLKSFDRAKIMENDSRIDQVVNERDLLREFKFNNINKLVQTTKSEDKLCLVLELA